VHVYKQRLLETIEKLALAFLKMKLLISFIQNGGLMKEHNLSESSELETQEQELDRALHHHVLMIRQTLEKIKNAKRSKMILFHLSSVVQKTIDSIEAVLGNIKKNVKDLLYNKFADHLLYEMLRSQTKIKIFEENKFDPSLVFCMDIKNKTIKLSTMLPRAKNLIDEIEAEYNQLLKLKMSPLKPIKLRKPLKNFLFKDGKLFDNKFVSVQTDE